MGQRDSSPLVKPTLPLSASARCASRSLTNAPTIPTITKTGLVQVARRYRILVVGDEARIRGALALYVTSGFDVRFAGGVDNAREALASVHLDAVIAERELSDPEWVGILEAALEKQPAARRLVRSSREVQPFDEKEVARLVHRVVDIEGGVEALIDAITAARL